VLCIDSSLIHSILKISRLEILISVQIWILKKLSDVNNHERSGEKSLKEKNEVLPHYFIITENEVAPYSVTSSSLFNNSCYSLALKLILLYSKL